ncbi:MAG: protein TolR [Halobacteriovoraceae bacterium]|nr:protein TolR [Halobacteriovoraceae bacterium]|tara:strand:- start:169932 stop:170348 length:417 start_codon:yes stop_codon:yes gene_type:complete
MGANLNKNKKGAIADINVTPLVDVMLVLLVIFMITAPLMLNGIKLELPKTKEVNPMNLTTKQVVLSMTLSGELFLGKDKVLKNEVINLVKGRFKEAKSEILYLRADYGIKYGNVARLMSYLKNSGITNIALVTEIEPN